VKAKRFVQRDQRSLPALSQSIVINRGRSLSQFFKRPVLFKVWENSLRDRRRFRVCCGFGYAECDSRQDSAAA
jgi:hypothetical protein